MEKFPFLAVRFSGKLCQNDTLMSHKMENRKSRIEETFENEPEAAKVDRRENDTKLNKDACEFVPGGLSDNVNTSVSVELRVLCDSKQCL